MAVLTEKDFDKLKEIVNDAILLHILSDDHRALEVIIAREKRRQDLWDKFKASVVGAMTIGLLFWLGKLVLAGFKIKIGTW